MKTQRALIFIDGENLVFRFQAMLKLGKKKKHDVIHLPDVAVWSPQVCSGYVLDVVRVVYYTSAVGDHPKLESLKQQLAEIRYSYQGAADSSLDPGVNWECQIVPFVVKKNAQSNKTRLVDIQIAIDCMRSAYLPSVDLLILLTGDGDFLSLIQELMRHGKQVYIGAFSSGLAEQLKYSADEFIDLDPLFFK